MAFIGQFYNLQIKNATYGIFVEKLYENMGIEFFKCVVEGKEYALLNNSPSMACLGTRISELISKNHTKFL